MNNDFSKDEIEATYKTIGKNVKSIRENAKLSQLELSLLMGYKSVSLVSASELCSSGKHFNIEHLYKIAKICNVDISELFNGISTTQLL